MSEPNEIVDLLNGGSTPIARDDELDEQEEEAPDEQEDTPEEDGDIEVEPAEDEEDEIEPAEVSDRERVLTERLEQITADKLALENARNEAQVSEQDQPTTPAEHNFLEGVDLDDVLSDAQGLNRVLVNVYNKGLADASARAAEQVMRSLPKLITTYVTQQTTMAEMVKDFYRENPDLEPVKRTVAAVANEISAESPGMPLQELFVEAAKRTRQVLNIQARTNGATKVPANTQKPAFVKQGARRKALPGLQGLAKEVQDLLS
jgi:hypothetical protein